MAAFVLFMEPRCHSEQVCEVTLARSLSVFAFSPCAVVGRLCALRFPHTLRNQSARPRWRIGVKREIDAKLNSGLF